MVLKMAQDQTCISDDNYYNYNQMTKQIPSQCWTCQEAGASLSLFFSNNHLHIILCPDTCMFCLKTAGRTTTWWANLDHAEPSSREAGAHLYLLSATTANPAAASVRTLVCHLKLKAAGWCASAMIWWANIDAQDSGVAMGPSWRWSKHMLLGIGGNNTPAMAGGNLSSTILFFVVEILRICLILLLISNKPI
jgi:hypothetical protein